MQNITTLFTNASCFINNQLQNVSIGVGETGRITHVGTDTVSQKNTTVIDLKGKYIYPSFEDAHNHPARRSRTLYEIDLRKAEVKWNDVRELIKIELQKKQKGEWIVCHGWHNDAWGEVTQNDLNGLSNEHGIFLIHSSYHGGLMNTFGLNVLKEKNIVVHDEQGILHEDDFEIAENATAPSTEVYVEAIKTYLLKYPVKGVTAVHDMYVANFNQLEAYRTLVETKEMPIPVIAYLDTRLLNYTDELQPFLSIKDEYFFVAGIKLFVDGTFGTRTAALYTSYKDTNGNGLVRMDVDDCINRIEKAVKLGLTHVAMHCIGERGIDTAIEVHKKAISMFGDAIKVWRFEHCEMPNDAAISYMSEHGIIASMQPNFLWDACHYENRIEQDVEKLNPFQKMISAGVPIVFGSDDMPTGPIEGIDWTVNQAPFEGQRLSIEKAMELYTKNSGELLGELNRGEIAVGKLANFIVCDELITKESILKGSEIIQETWVAGKKAYSR